MLSDFWPLAVVGLISLGIGFPMILFPFGQDQAIFAYIAHRISIGGFPYVSAWDQKPPAIYLLYVIAIHFPGPMMRNVRLFDLFMLCLALSAIYLLAWQIWGRVAAAFAALLYGAAYTTEYGYWHTAQPDGYTTVPVCLAAWLYYRYLSSRRIWPYAVAGMLTGFAFQLRFFSALIGVALLYIEWNRARSAAPWRWTDALRRILWFSVGFALVQALFAIYLLAGHALGAYLQTEFGFASHYARLGGPYSPNGFTWALYLPAVRSNTLYFLTTHMFITIPALVALSLAFRRDGDRRVREIALIGLTAYLGVLIQAKFFWYHWLAVLPFACLLGGKGLADIAIPLFRRRSRVAALAGTAAILVGLLLVTPAVTDTALQQWQGVAGYYGGPARREAYNNQFGSYSSGPYSYLADDQVARYIQARTTSHDTIYVYGYEALIYLVSGRESASRFIYVFPVISPWAPAAWRAGFVNELETKAPRYILVQSGQGAPWIDGLHEDTGEYAAHDADLQRILASRYVLETQIQAFTIYRLRD